LHAYLEKSLENFDEKSGFKSLGGREWERLRAREQEGERERERGEIPVR
jgi:hypothetical protein